MMPLAERVAFSGSDSNHCSTKSAALIVISLASMYSCSCPSPRKWRAISSRPIMSLGWSVVGSGGMTPRMYLTALAMKYMERA